MRPEILQLARDVWHHHLGLLDDALDESIRSLRNLLRLDDHHRHGHESSRLQESLGPFGSSIIDMGALSRVLGKSDRSLGEDRRQRINRLLQELANHQERCAAEAIEMPVLSLDEPTERIHAEAETHLNQMAAIFGALRRAQLEIHSKYKPLEHDPFFGAFGWRELNPTELSLCPPFLIEAELGDEHEADLIKAMPLLSSRKPVKLVASRVSLRKAHRPTADPSIPAGISLEMLPIAMRGVFFLQGCLSIKDFEQRIFEALTAPRPSFISLLARRETENEEAFELRAERALASKAFPTLLYNPDKAPGFVACLDLSGNPVPDKELDFIDFAAGEPDFVEDFNDPHPETPRADLIPVNQFLSLTRRQRTGKFPCYLQQEDPTPKVVSANLVTQISDSRHLWRTLRELAGQDNPHVAATRDQLKQEFKIQQKSLLEAQKEDMEKEARHRERVAVATAVKRLVSSFAQVDPGSIDLQKMLAAVPEGTPPPEEENNS